MGTTTTDRRLGLSGNLAFKKPCKVATTANITLSGTQTVDGIALVGGERVLVWKQTAGVDNGIYLASTGTWTRDIDFDGSYDAVQGTMLYVNSGTVYGGSTFQCSTPDTFIIGTTALTFGQIGQTLGSLTSLTLSSNLTVSGTLTSSGAASFSSSAAFTGAVSLSSALTVSGYLTASTSSVFTGAVSMSSALTVTGTATFSGAVTASSAMTVSGYLTASTSSLFTGAVSMSSALTVTNTMTASTGVLLLNGSSAPAGGSSNYGVRLTGTAGFGVYVGSSAPTLSAAQGSLYLRTEGGSSLTRAYINTAGTTVWTAILTSS